MNKKENLRSMTDMAHHSRSESEQKNLMKRLKIIEGQIRGLEKMV